jgi:hypothetical protein
MPWRRKVADIIAPAARTTGPGEMETWFSLRTRRDVTLEDR